MCKWPVITHGKIWWVGRMCQHLPTPTLHQHLHLLAFDGHGMFKHKSISAEEHYACDLQSTWIAPCSFLPRWRTHYSAFCCFSWGSNKSIHDMSTIKMRSRNALAWFLWCCRWVLARRIRVAVWSSRSMCGVHLHKLWFPKAVGEDMVNTCWRDSNFSNSFRARNTLRMFKDRFPLFHVAFISCWCRGSTMRGIACPFLAILSGFHPWANSFVWRDTCT